MMFRPFITAMLLIATVIGPQWCCCRVRADAGEVKAEVVNHDLVIKKSCCTQKLEGESEKKSPTENHSCPCRQHSQDLMNASGTTEVATGSSQSSHSVWEMLVLDASCCVAQATMPTVQPMTLPDDSPAPLGGRDLLRAYHILRC